MAHNRRKISEGTKVLILNQLGRASSKGVVLSRTEVYFNVLDFSDNTEKRFTRDELKKNKWQDHEVGPE